MACVNSASSNTNRIIALVDMDCFYVQVEQRRDKKLRGKPCVVVQYKKWRGGGIIAVGYEARKFGVTRQMRGDDAKAKCPDVNIIYVKENRGKADLSIYREAGAEVIKVLSTFSDCLERASIDEAYIDLSETVKSHRMKYNINEIAVKLLQTTHVVDISHPDDFNEDITQSPAYATVMQRLALDSNLNLAVGAIVANEMREAVLEKTQFTCSAGVAHNKMLAKLIGGMHKPKQQTVIFLEDIPVLYKTVKISKVRHLGGKLGKELQDLFKIETMAELASINLIKLKQVLGDKNGEWIYWLGQGVDTEPIRIRQLPQSVGCCKNFRGPDKLDKMSSVSHWLQQLASEVSERLEQEIEVNNRVATHMVVTLKNPKAKPVSRSCKINGIDEQQIFSDAMRLIRVFNNSDCPEKWDPAILLLGISTSKFEEYNCSNNKSIKDFMSENQSMNTTSFSSSSTYAQSSGKTPEGSKPKKEPRGLDRFFSSMKNKIKDNGCNTMPADAIDLEIEDEIIEEESYSILGGDSKIMKSQILTKNSEREFEGNEFLGKDASIKTKSEDTNCTVFSVENENRGTSPVEGSKKPCNNSLPSDDSSALTISSATQSSTCKTMSLKAERPDMSNSSMTTMSGFCSTSTVTASISAEDFVICSKCGKRILIWEMPEHNDFHFAQDLQHDMNKNNFTPTKTKRNELPPAKKVKRSSSSIHDFFKPK